MAESSNCRVDDLGIGARGVYRVSRVEELRGTAYAMQSPAFQMFTYHVKSKVACAAGPKEVLATERPQSGAHTGIGQLRECQAVLRRKVRPPVHINVVGGARHLAAF